MTHALNEAAHLFARKTVDAQGAGSYDMLVLAFKRGALWGAHDRGAVDALVSDEEVEDLIENKEEYKP